MSRINRAIVADGETIAAADLNSRFTDYQQTDINEFNHRDAAYDLPQFDRPGASTFGFIGQYQKAVTIGVNSWKHASSTLVTGQNAAPPGAPFIVSDGGGTPTVLSFGVAGITVAADELLRIYWDLSVYPHWEGTRPWVGHDDYTITDGTGGTTAIGTNASCWAFWLQWDVTSNALANWTEVPNQGAFNTNFTGSVYGSPLSDCTATTVVPAYIDRGAPQSGALPSTPVSVAVGWRGISGTWYYPKTTGSQVIYGLRIVFSGILHPYYNTGTSSNALTRSTSWSSSAKLRYAGGKMHAVKQKVG